MFIEMAETYGLNTYSKEDGWLIMVRKEDANALPLGNEKYFVPWLPSYFVNLSTGFKELGRESEMLMDLDRSLIRKM